MLVREFESVPVKRGFLSLEFPQHREIIRRHAREGRHDQGFLPSPNLTRSLMEIDLVLEREVEDA